MMQPPRQTTPTAQSAKDLFLDLLETGSDATAYDRLLAGVSPELRQEALRLLASHSRASDLLTEPRASQTQRAGANIAGYQIGEELGRGAFGAVYRHGKSARLNAMWRSSYCTRTLQRRRFSRDSARKLAFWRDLSIRASRVSLTRVWMMKTARLSRWNLCRARPSRTMHARRTCR